MLCRMGFPMEDENLSFGERNTIIQTIEEFKNSSYWSILKKQILFKMQEKEKYLNSFTMSRMDNKKIEDYNEVLIRLDEIKKFLSINDDIIKRHSTILERLIRETRFNEMIEKLLPNGFTKWFKDFGNKESLPK